MTSQEIRNFIDVRNCELNTDEIFKVTDISANTQINHIVYEDDRWKMWDIDGNFFTFVKRNWH